MTEEKAKEPAKDITDKDVEQWFENKFSKEWCKGDHKKKSDKVCKTSAGAGAGLYFIGFIGAIVYYIGASTSFWDGVLGILKSLVWPAFLVYHLMDFLGM